MNNNTTFDECLGNTCGLRIEWLGTTAIDVYQVPYPFLVVSGLILCMSGLDMMSAQVTVNSCISL